MQAIFGGSARGKWLLAKASITLIVAFQFATLLGVAAVTRPHADTALRVHVTETPPKDFRLDFPDDFASAKHGLIYEVASPNASLGYLHWAHIDRWFCSQLADSALHVKEVAHADIIFVSLAVGLEFQYFDLFIQEAEGFLPLFRTKPHVVILQYPMMVHFQRNASFIEHPNSKHFTFIVLDHVQGQDLVFPRSGERHFDASNYVIAPYPAHVHWGYRDSRKLDWTQAQAAIAQKQRLAFESFVVRSFPDRYACYESCMARPSQCLHHNFTGETDVADLMREQLASWYTVQPMGDYIVRNSLFDTFMWLSIPVMFEEDIIEHLPFNDVLDYAMLLQHVPKARILGEEKENLIDQLERDFDRAEAKGKLGYMYKVHHVFQYAVEPQWRVVSFNKRHVLAEGDDALTFTLKAVLRNICARGMLHRRCRIH